MQSSNVMTYDILNMCNYINAFQQCRRCGCNYSVLAYLHADLCIFLYVLAKEVSKPQKLLYFCDIGRVWLVLYSLYLLGVRLQAILTLNVAQVCQFCLAPHTLGRLQVYLELT